MKCLYNITRKLADQPTDKPVKDKQSKLASLTTLSEQLSRWTEHFFELFNRPAPEGPSDMPPAETPPANQH